MKKKRHTWRYYFNLILVFVFPLFLALILLIAYLTDKWTQSTLHPARIPSTGDSLKAEHIPFRKVKLTTSDGLQLAAWYTAPKLALSGVEGNGAVILVAHGYNANRPENMYSIFVAKGYGVLAWDFRAHGSSGGDMSTLGYYEQLDVEAALDYVLAQEGVEHVGAWGGSMGAATVILTAAKRTEIEAVVTDSAYPTLEDVLKVNLPLDFLVPFAMLSGKYHSGTDVNNVRPVDEIGKISPRPVFVIDGWEGASIIMNSPYRLYDAANEPKQIWVEQGVPHLGMLANNQDEYKKQVIGFFDKWLLEK